MKDIKDTGFLLSQDELKPDIKQVNSQETDKMILSIDEEHVPQQTIEQASPREKDKVTLPIDGKHVPSQQISAKNLPEKAQSRIGTSDMPNDAIMDKPEVSDKEKALIKDLKKYIKRIESHKNEDKTINFAFGFGRFFKNSRAINREVNYHLAKDLLKKLKEDPHPLNEVMKDLGEQRKKVAIKQGLFSANNYKKLGKTGIHSKQLNGLIKRATKI